MASSDQAELRDENRRLRARVAELEDQLARLGSPSESVEDSSLVTIIRRLMEDAPVGFAFLNTDSRYEVVNQKLAEMNGVPASLHIGRTAEEIFPHLADQAQRAFQEVIVTGKPVLDVQFSGEAAEAPGILRHRSESWYPINAANGQLLGVGAIITDITEHKQALEALCINQQRLELAQAAAGIGSWDWDLRTNEIHCSMEYGPLFGLPPGRLAPPYEKCLELVHPEDREMVQEELRRVLGGVEEYRVEYRVVWPDGTIHWLLDKGRAVRDVEGKATRLIGVNTDITRRKRAEQASREIDQRFRSVADSASVMICASDPDASATFFNKGWLSFTGRTMDQEMGFGWTEGLHPEDRDRALADMRASSEGRRYCHMEYRLRRADGTYRWILCSGAPRFETDGSFAGYVASALDITDFKHSHEEALARQKLESLGVLAGGIAHDFNNLLASILADAELLEGDLPAGSAVLEGITRIKLVAGRAARIVRELLAFAGKDKADFKPVDISALVREMLDLLKVSISKRADLKIDLSDKLPAVRANPSQIWQVVLNLVTNASQALEGHDGIITLITSPAQIVRGASADWGGNLPEGNYVRLEVRDTGCGMTKETLARIFDPFFTTKFTGRGLGLAAVQGIVGAHGGEIHVFSTPGNGARFEVLLPSIAEPAVDVASVAECGPERQSENAASTILLVEDETALRAPVSKMLTKKGYSVIEAGDGLDGVAAFRAHAREIAVVLLDMTLPGMSGGEVLSELRRIHPHIKVILTTAYSEEKVLNDLGGEQSWAFIRKPYQFGDLMHLLQRILQEKEASAASPGGRQAYR